MNNSGRLLDNNSLNQQFFVNPKYSRYLYIIN